MAFTAFDMGLGELDEQLSPLAMVSHGWLLQQTPGLLEAPRPERLLSLPQCQPCESEHA